MTNDQRPMIKERFHITKVFRTNDVPKCGLLNLYKFCMFACVYPINLHINLTDLTSIYNKLKKMILFKYT